MYHVSFVVVFLILFSGLVSRQDGFLGNDFEIIFFYGVVCQPLVKLAAGATRFGSYYKKWVSANKKKNKKAMTSFHGGYARACARFLAEDKVCKELAAKNEKKLLEQT